jgi:hypothetical protein
VCERRGRRKLGMIALEKRGEKNKKNWMIVLGERESKEEDFE